LACFDTKMSQYNFHGEEYQKEESSIKAAQLWEALISDQISKSWPNELYQGELFVEPLDKTFDWVGDDMPTQFLIQRRPKLVHSVGVVAQARLVITNNTQKYTGIFESGCKHALVRMSLATKPNKIGITPGLALKFLRTGQHSANMFALYSTSPQTGFNFFAHDLTNHIPEPFHGADTVLKLLRSRFANASKFPNFIGLSDMALYDEHGKKAQQPKFPFRLIFHPRKNVHIQFPEEDPTIDFATQLSTQLDRGILYDLYVQDEPDATPVKFGYIETLCQPHTSHFGDVGLFFQHTRMENDFAYRPEWKEKSEAIMDQQMKANSQFYFPDLPWEDVDS
jgi:hypothetical protein